ncbi:hypothetical protein WME98_40710 [Sorangium sp. So ce296]|uniref:Secreted protein n=1 Tax=Sorangium cellulosum TaxID=56 RepID=A0A150T374_SORCE|nr:hypothetical protein BE20_13925 [Sorangium cellulosum]KYF99093.1 hypothetical protein BE18_37320 [Sorangium cellulosum]
MILHRIKSAGLFLAGAAVAALAFAGPEAAASETGPSDLEIPPDIQPPTTPCGACYNMRSRLLYVSLAKVDKIPAVVLDLYEPDGGGAGTYGALKPVQVNTLYAVYYVPQGPTKDVGSGVVRWKHPYGYVRTEDVTVDDPEPQCDE